MYSCLSDSQGCSVLLLDHASDEAGEIGIDFNEKLGNCENYIKEAKYDMAVGDLLLKSFWEREMPR